MNQLNFHIFHKTHYFWQQIKAWQSFRISCRAKVNRAPVNMEWSCECVWPAGVLWSPDQGVAALAGRSGHAAEEEGDRGQAAVGQQAGQTATGQRGDRWGTTQRNPNSDNNYLTVLGLMKGPLPRASLTPVIDVLCCYDGEDIFTWMDSRFWWLKVGSHRSSSLKFPSANYDQI